jgi:hypothetical protein
MASKTANPAAGCDGARDAELAETTIGNRVSATPAQFLHNPEGLDLLEARIRATSPLLPLLAQRQWAVWRYEPPRNGGKPSKVPYRAKNPARHASANDASHWCDFDTAIAAAREHGFDGVCFALTDTTRSLRFR